MDDAVGRAGRFLSYTGDDRTICTKGGPAASERAGHGHGARRTERGAEEAGGAMPEQKHRGSRRRISGTAGTLLVIGGMTVRIGDQVLDGSVRTRLRRMKEELLTWNGKAGEESR